MDPLANITEQIALAAQIIALVDEGALEDGTLVDEAAQKIAEHANRLAELVQTLDEWRRRGGFDPYGGDPIARLYDVATDHELTVLEDLAVRAELRWVCPIRPWTNVTGETCGECGRSQHDAELLRERLDEAGLGLSPSEAEIAAALREADEREEA